MSVCEQWLAFCYFEGGRLVLKRSETADSQTHRHLQEGWIFGHRVDVADGQYRFFRNEIPILTVAAIGFLALSHAVRFLSNNVSQSFEDIIVDFDSNFIF